MTSTPYTDATIEAAVLETAPSGGPPHGLLIDLPEPRSIEETGLQPHTLTELVAKTMYYRSRVTEGQLCDLVRVTRPVVDELMDLMKRDGLTETLSQAGPLQYQYALTDRGRRHAFDAFERGHYVGPAPVPYEQYVAVQQAQAVRSIEIHAADVAAALGHLVQPDALVSAVGAGVVSADTLMLYGHSGNGKSTVAAAIREMLRTPIAIPHALDVGGQTLRLFDARMHEEVEPAAAPTAYAAPTVDAGGHLTIDDTASPFGRTGYDRRYAICHRPLVTLGSELTLDDLELGFSPVDLTYTAPPQVKANGGVLVVDDLGRQRVRPEELLNRWMAPMATGIDQLGLRTGELIRVPFDVILVFATNLEPHDIGDEAFLRRIRHKVQVPDPTRQEYREIFHRAAEAAGLTFDARAVETVLTEFYDTPRRPLRGSHPGDIIRNLLDFAAFEGAPPAFTVEALRRACRAYFV